MNAIGGQKKAIQSMIIKSRSTLITLSVLSLILFTCIGCGVIANPKFDIYEANRQVSDVKLIADKNLSKTIHDFLIENPKASVADVKQGNSEYKVQYPVYSYSYKTNTVDVYYFSEDGIITGYKMEYIHWFRVGRGGITGMKAVETNNIQQTPKREPSLF